MKVAIVVMMAVVVVDFVCSICCMIRCRSVASTVFRERMLGVVVVVVVVVFVTQNRSSLASLWR